MARTTKKFSEKEGWITVSTLSAEGKLTGLSFFRKETIGSIGWAECTHDGCNVPHHFGYSVGGSAFPCTSAELKELLNVLGRGEEAVLIPDDEGKYSLRTVN